MIRCHNNVDAWNVLVEKCYINGYKQEIQRGSFAGGNTVRYQLEPLMIEICSPLDFTYLPKDITPGMIENYYEKYIISPEVAKNETYTYGSRINLQLQTVMDMLARTPNTNQASISISQPSDIHLSDPPCLREITFSFFEGRLHMTSFWRSNDIKAAFLLNQGGLALLLRDVAEYAGWHVGSHFYCSPGAHVYDYGSGGD